MVPSRAGACLAVALLFMGAGQAAAQSGQSPPATQPPPAQGQPQAEPQPQAQPPPPPQTGAQAPQQPTQPTEPATTRQGRTGREQRATTRRPSSNTRGSSDEGRQSRDAGPVRQELTISANVLGGYDDNLTAGLGSGAGAVPTAPTSGYTGFMDAALNYFRGTSQQSIRVQGAGNLRVYPDYLDDPAPGGLALFEGRTMLGRTHTLTVSERVAYEPLFTAGLIGVSGVPQPPLTGEGAPPTPGVPVTGLFERQSWTSNTDVSLERRWSRRDTTRVSYNYTTQRYTSDDYGDNHYNQATAEYRRRLDRGTTVRTTYRYLDGNYTDYAGDTYPRTEQTVEGGPEFTKVLRGQRRLFVSIGAGATWVEGLNSVTREPYDDWVPTASASGAWDFTDTWWLRGDYRRGFTALQGLTDQLYSTDTASVRIGGPVMPRTELAVGGSFADGRTTTGSGVSDTFTVYGASVVMQVAVSSTLSATAGYFYYQHRYSNPGALPEGFPSEYDRNAFRAGLTFWMPLAGTSSRRPQAPGIPY